MNKLYLCEVPDLSLLEQRKEWIVRDGIIPILWFFNKFPNPEKLNSRLYIREDFCCYVPNSWRKNVGSFELFNVKSDRRPSKIGLLGLLSESYVSPVEFDQRMAFLARSFEGRKVKGLEKFCFLPTRSPLMAPKLDSPSCLIEFILSLSRHFGDNMSSQSYYQIVGTPDYLDSYVLDIGDGLLNADNCILHHALSKGAKLWHGNQFKTPPKGKRILFLSEFHGLLLNTEPKINSKIHKSQLSMQEIQKFISITKTPAFQTIPWPEIFGDWVQALIERSKT